LVADINSVSTGVRPMFGLKHGKVGNNINNFKPGYHVSNVRNVVTTPRKINHAFIIR
jgi:hypothetical protein